MVPGHAGEEHGEGADAGEASEGEACAEGEGEPEAPGDAGEAGGGGGEEDEADGDVELADDGEAACLGACGGEFGVGPGADAAVEVEGVEAFLEEELVGFGAASTGVAHDDGGFASGELLDA